LNSGGSRTSNLEQGEIGRNYEAQEVFFFEKKKQKTFVN